MRPHMGYEAAPRQGSRENAVLRPQSAPPPGSFMILNYLSPFWNQIVPFCLPVFSCDPCPRSFSAPRFSRHPAPAPRPASSSSPTRLTATASISAWPRARNAAPPSPAPTASHEILPRHQAIAGSTPTKLPALSPNPAQTAPMAIATNMSQSLASAEFARSWRSLGPVHWPPKRRDDAAGSGYWEGALRGPNCFGVQVASASKSLQRPSHIGP
ncbi:hypothetical protein ABH973_005468 [Bradyrhizobium ottawaense]